jgi:hypothetical protein
LIESSRTNLRFVGEVSRSIAHKEELVAARVVIDGEGCEQDHADGECGNERCIIWIIVRQGISLNDDITGGIELTEITCTCNANVENEVDQD